jgi:hypothetical protein
MNHRSTFFALVVLIGLAGLAPTLPKLNVNPASNRTVVITWPYTNAGFALQESGRLTNWQSSQRTPVFNSNAETFAVAAVGTNPARFFRLAQPADLRGIYVNTPLGGGPNNPASASVTNAIRLPGMDGMFIAGLWSDLETNYNQYDWSHLDKWIVTRRRKTRK